MKLSAITGMPRQRFDDLWSALRWSTQPKDRPQDVSHAEHWWILINDMVDIFNQHWKDNLYPVNGYVLTSPYHDGMDMSAIVSTFVFQCMEQLIESQKVAVKFKIVHAGKVG